MAKGQKKIEKLVSNINAWDKSCVSELLERLNELREVCADNELDFANLTDMTELPSCYFDKNLPGPIWAVDVDGWELIGDGADSIESIAELEKMAA